MNLVHLRTEAEGIYLEKDLHYATRMNLARLPGVDQGSIPLYQEHRWLLKNVTDCLIFLLARPPLPCSPWPLAIGQWDVR